MQEVINTKKTSKKVSYDAWMKAGLVFGSSVGAFAVAKTSGVLSWLGGLSSAGDVTGSTEIKTVDSEKSIVEGFQNTSVTQANFSTWLKQVDNHLVVFEAIELPKVLPKAVITEFQVNTFVDNNQANPSVAVLTDGGFVITWQSDQQDPDGSQGVYGQRYDATGAALGSEFRINTAVSGAQSNPSVAALNNNGFIVTWESQGAGIFAQRYGSTGATVGSEFKVNTLSNGGDSSPSVAALNNGSFVIAWTGSNQQDENVGIFAQQYDANGVAVGTQFKINTFTAGDQSDPSVTALNNGGFVVVWKSALQDGSGFGVYGQRYGSTGAAAGSEFRVNTFTTDNQQLPSVTGLTDGGFIVVWTSDSQDGSSTSVQAQRYDATGATLGNEFRVNTFTSGFQSRPSVTTLSSGGFIVTWTSQNQDGSGTSVQAQRYDVTGATVGNEFRVNSFTANDQDFSAVAALTNGGFIVTWRSDGQDAGTSAGIFARLFTPPTLISNTLSIQRDQTVVLSSHELSATDLDTASNSLTFTATEIQNGRFAFGSSLGTPITSFSQAQLSNGQVVFVHTGGPNAPSYKISVSDDLFSTEALLATIQFDGSPSSTVTPSSTPSSSTTGTLSRTLTATPSSSTSRSITATLSRSATVTPTPSNGAPVLLKNVLSLHQGETVILGTDELHATDSEINPNLLIFIVSDLQNGRFAFSSTGVTTTRFSQQQLSEGQVIFVHTGGQHAPSYQVSVTDGVTATSPVAATIHFNASPVLINNTLTIHQNQTLVLTNSSLSATDIDDSSDSLIFVVSHIQNGRFSLISSSETAITRFSQQQLVNEQVIFVHTGESNAPSYQVQVSDGVSETTPVSAAIHFNSNPTLVNNQLTIRAGQTITLSSNNLSATGGLDNNPATLIFEITSVQGGQFELVSNSGVAINTFTQEQVNAGQIRFVHFGAGAPSYQVSVSNGVVSTALVSGIINFDTSSTPVPKERSSSSNIQTIVGATLGGVVGGLGLIGGLLYSFKARQKASSKQLVLPKNSLSEITQRSNSLSAIEIPVIQQSAAQPSVRLLLLEEHGLSPRTAAFQGFLISLGRLIEKHKLPKKTFFISYAWEERGTPELEELQFFLKRLADDLRTIGMTVFLDIQNNTGDMPNWMEQSIKRSDYFLVIGTPRYRLRAEDPKTAVALEYGLISSITAQSENRNMLIPLLYSGNWNSAFPKDVSRTLIRDVSDFKKSNSYHLNLVGVERPLGVIPHCYPCFAVGGDLQDEYQALFNVFGERLKYLAEYEKNLHLRNQSLAPVHTKIKQAEIPIEPKEVHAKPGL